MNPNTGTIVNRADAVSAIDRNKLGQYFTPEHLARQMVDFALSIMTTFTSVRFIEPGFGHGAFFNMLLTAVPKTCLAKAWGYEVDQACIAHAKRQWPDGFLDLIKEDFTTAIPPKAPDEKPNLLLCNPPYVRHHHLSTDQKKQLQLQADKVSGVNLNGRAGLYCYFILLAHGWLAPGAVAGWLLPSEFLDADYSLSVREYLTTRVTLLRVHQFATSESLFEDATVSSAIMFYQYGTPTDDHEVSFSFGGSLSSPNATTTVKLSKLKHTRKWSNLVGNRDAHLSISCSSQDQPPFKIADLFEVKRGIATGANDFFILSEAQVNKLQLPHEFLKPILPSSRHLVMEEIEADEIGDPQIDFRYYLLDCSMKEEELRNIYPYLWTYLEEGKSKGLHLRTLCRSRKPWYAQESRPPAPILCKYMGNGSRSTNNPIRFILNHSRATATNSYYLLYPRPDLQVLLDTKNDAVRLVWSALNAIPIASLIAHGRRYGGGMVKIEPRELENMLIYGVSDLMLRR